MKRKNKFIMRQVVAFWTHESKTPHFEKIVDVLKDGWYQIDWGGIIAPIHEDRMRQLTKYEIRRSSPH